jgi:hypothetical protein
MKYKYMEFFTEHIKVEISELKHDDSVFGGQKVIVYFINTLTGAKGTAMLPTYEWLDKGKLSKNDIAFCNELLRTNNSLIFRDAREGVLPIA